MKRMVQARASKADGASKTRVNRRRHLLWLSGRWKHRWGNSLANGNLGGAIFGRSV